MSPLIELLIWSLDLLDWDGLRHLLLDCYWLLWDSLLNLSRRRRPDVIKFLCEIETGHPDWSTFEVCGSSEDLNLAVVLVDFDAEVVVEGHIRFVCRLRPHRCDHSLVFEQLREVGKSLAQVCLRVCCLLFHFQIVLRCHSFDCIIEFPSLKLHLEVSFDLIFNFLRVDQLLLNRIWL